MNRKKVAYLLVALLCLVGLLAGACAAPAEEPTPKAEVITLKFNVWTSQTTAEKLQIVWYLDTIEERTNHRVEFERYWSASLIPVKHEPEQVASGVADLAYMLAPYVPGRLPLLTVTGLPGIPKDMEQFGKDCDKLSKMKVIQDEFTDQNLVYLATLGGDPRGCISKEPVRTLDDMKGKTYRATGDEAKVLATLGAASVPLPAAELYEGFQRGTVDGEVLSLNGAGIYKLYEIGKYWTDLNIGFNDFYYFGNKATFDSLPRDVKKVFDELAEEMPKVFYEQYLLPSDEDYKKVFTEAGVEFLTLSPADVERLAELSKPIWDEWVETHEAKGLPAREVINEWLKINGINVSY